MDKLDENQRYKATIVLSSKGTEDIVTLEEISFTPDVSDEMVDAGMVPWSVKLASHIIAQLHVLLEAASPTEEDMCTFSEEEIDAMEQGGQEGTLH